MCAIPFRQDGPPYGPPAFMDFALFTRLIEQYEGLETLHLQGLGEPMMHPRFFDMVSYARDRGIFVSTNTNMTLLNEKRASLCVGCGLDEIHISIDGAKAETYERIRLKGNYDKVIRNIKLLQQAKEGARSLTPRMKLVMVIMRQNLEELPDLVRQAYEWSMVEIFVQHLSHDFGEANLPEQYLPMREFVDEQTLLEEDLEKIEKYFGEARDIATQLGIHLRLPKTRMRLHPPGTPGPKRCSWPWKGGYISYQGYMMPCCMVSTPDRINFGSSALVPVEEIWNSSDFQDFRTRLSSDTPPEVCTACSIYKGTF